jgi:hypothetical protein
VASKKKKQPQQQEKNPQKNNLMQIGQADSRLEKEDRTPGRLSCTRVLAFLIRW